MEPSNEQLLWMYETMLVIREFEETMVSIYLEGKLPPNIQKGLAFDIGGGPVPGEMQSITIFSAGIPTVASDAATGKALRNFSQLPPPAR